MCRSGRSQSKNIGFSTHPWAFSSGLANCAESQTSVDRSDLRNATPGQNRLLPLALKRREYAVDRLSSSGCSCRVATEPIRPLTALAKRTGSRRNPKSGRPTRSAPQGMATGQYSRNGGVRQHGWPSRFLDDSLVQTVVPESPQSQEASWACSPPIGKLSGLPCCGEPGMSACSIAAPGCGQPAISARSIAALGCVSPGKSFYSFTPGGGCAT